MHLYEWYWLAGVVMSILYFALILWFVKGWNNIDDYKSISKVSEVKVSVVVPFCDEGEHLETCIKGLLAQDFRSEFFEIFLVNDHSSDKSPIIAQTYANHHREIIYVDNDIPGKKNALLKGIEHASGDVIVTTDADCTYGNKWLSTLISFQQVSKAKLVIGPVLLNPIKGLFQHFQYIEFVSLIGTGAGAAGIKHAIMCNGANLVFHKETFDTLEDPFNMKYASGDDVFLLHAMKKEHGEDIYFLKAKEAIVYTAPKEDLSTFFNQRSRWASKAKGYKDSDTLFTAFIVLLNAALIACGFLFVFFKGVFWKPLLFILLTKTFADLLFFYSVNAFFKTKRYLKYLLCFEIVYAFYVAFSALMGLRERKWK